MIKFAMMHSEEKGVDVVGVWYKDRYIATIVPPDPNGPIDNTLTVVSERIDDVLVEEADDSRDTRGIIIVFDTVDN